MINALSRLRTRMKPEWIVFLLLFMAAPVWGQSADKAEPSVNAQPRAAKGKKKTVPSGTADPLNKTGEGPAAPGAVSVETEKKKTPAPLKKLFIDENGDGLSDSPSPDAKRNPRATGPSDGRSMDRFTDPDGDGINEGRGFERGRLDRGKNALEENLKGKNNLREKGKK